jgi:Mannosyltransferase (PIG-V)
MYSPPATPPLGAPSTQRQRPEVRGASRRAPLADVWTALWASRLLVWLAGVYAILAVGYRPTGGAPHLGAPLGHLGELVFGPADRWDAAFYLSIATHSYHPGPVSAFFPFYPIAIAGLNVLLGSPLVAGIAISFVSFAAALYFMHRLVALELGARHARTAVLALAFFPTSLFFSAVYPEALLLALTIGAVYAARTGRWAWAGILGACASATHNAGVLLAIPIAALYLYGPRADRDRPHVDRDGVHADRHDPRDPAIPWWRPRYAPRLDSLWILLVPLGLVAFFAYMGLEYGDALRPLHLNDTIWHRHFVLLGGITQMPSALWHTLHTIATAQPSQMFPATNGPYRIAAANMLDLAALGFALIAAIGVARRLPLAYSAYTIVALVVIVSAPKASEPLVSLPRYILVLFPLQMWLAMWLDERRGRAAVWLACSAVVLGALSMQFATGRWVA